MYRWIWRQLPSTRLMRLAVLTMLLVGVVAVLMLVVFPYVDARLPVSQVTVRR